MKKKSRLQSPWTVLATLLLAVFVGAVIDKEGAFGGVVYRGCDLIGTLFLNALTLVVVPLVASSIIMGVARIASESQFGRLGLKTFGWFITLNAIAILIGMLICLLIAPGKGLGTQMAALGSQLPLPSISREGAFSKLILDIVPSNVLAAFAKGNMLGLIFFSLLFGYAITQIGKKNLQTHLLFWKGVFEAMLRIVHGIMFFLPLGVFCLATRIFATAGITSLKPMGKFVFTTLLGLALFAFVLIPLLIHLIARVNFIRYFRAMWPAVVTAFSTGSSSATLPISLECMEERVGVSNRICSLVVPLGTSVNLSATALYNGIVGLFVAQAFGISLEFTQLIAYFIVTLITSFGVASIPGGGLISVITILHIMGLPAEGIGLIMAVDRILDLFRTSVNVLSYTTCATLVAKSEGETQILKDARNDHV